MSSPRRKWAGAVALGLVLACGASDLAMAQFFFRPFAYTYRYDPFPDDEPPRYASRPAVARILAREGYRLVGRISRRGDQIVAHGVNARDGEIRFVIDPYDGEIVNGVRVAPSPEEQRPFVERHAAPVHPAPAEPEQRRSFRARDREAPHDAERPRRMAPPAGESPAQATRRKSPDDIPPRPKAPPAERTAAPAATPAAPPAEPVKPTEWAAPPEISKQPTVTTPPEAPKADTSRPAEAQSDAKADAGSASAPKAPVANKDGAAAAHRAIVPPKPEPGAPSAGAGGAPQSGR